MPDVALRDSPLRWLLMLLLAVAMIFCYVHRAALSVAAPFMIEQMHLSRATMGILLSAFFWSYCLMQVPAGWVVDRFGVRAAYAAGFAFWTLASGATGFAGGLLALVLLRMCLGVGQAVAFPASARAVANWFQDRERGVVSAVYLIGVRLGTALVGAVGVTLIAVYGLPLFFLIISVTALVWVPMWFLFVGRWGGAERSPGPRTNAVSFRESVLLLKDRTVLGIFLGFFAYDYAWFVYLNWLPGYLKLERGFSDREMGIYSAVPYVAMSVIILASGFLSDWLVGRGHSEQHVRKVFIAVGMTIACLIVPAGLTEDKMTAVWLLTISLCGLGVATPNTWTLTQAVCSKHLVGTVSGIQNFGGNIGGVIAPVLTGYIAHVTDSFALALGLTGAILVGGILSYIVLIARPVKLP